MMQACCESWPSAWPHPQDNAVTFPPLFTHTNSCDTIQKLTGVYKQL